MKIKMRFTCLTVFITMCAIVVIKLMWDIKKLHSQSFRLLPTQSYEENIFAYKHILLWTDSQKEPFRNIEEGKATFVSYRCPFTNCMVTNNRSFLGDYTLFDVIAFRAEDIVSTDNLKLPQKRLPHQKYVFVSVESPHYYPLCTDRFNGYFNWTWTYKLDSEVRWGYIVIKDSRGNIIGPKKSMKWIDWKDMGKVTAQIKNKIKSKRKPAAWFVSNCQSKSQRENFVEELQQYLNHYDLEIDIFGKCGDLECDVHNQAACNKKIEKDYFFYLAFENALSEDYVTEKLLIPLQNNAVPIVYGGADYTRFLPNGSYLDARELGVHALGDKIITLIHDPDQYAEYFRWKNYYSYHRTLDIIQSNEYCQICALLNNANMTKKKSVYENIREWWVDYDNNYC